MSNVLSKAVYEERAKFIKALKSDEFTQCRDAYTKQGDFCVLGVAINLTHDDIAGIVDEREANEMLVDVENKYSLLPHHTSELIFMNDNLELSFHEIANSLVGRGFLDINHYPLS